MNPIQSGLGTLHILSHVLVTTFLLGLFKLKVNRKVDLPPEYQLTWSKGGSFVNSRAISHHQNRQVIIWISLILCHIFGHYSSLLNYSIWLRVVGVVLVLSIASNLHISWKNFRLKVPSLIRLDLPCYSFHLLIGSNLGFCPLQKGCIYKLPWSNSSNSPKMSSATLSWGAPTL